PELFLREGATGDLGRIDVRCGNCGASQPMNRAKSAFPFDCRGDRPWRGGRNANEECDQKLQLLVRTGSHAYFSQVVSALRLPDPEVDPLQQRVRDKKLWEVLKDAPEEATVATLLGLVGFVREALEGFTPAQIARAVQ